jgi:hypothetical protein
VPRIVPILLYHMLSNNPDLEEHLVYLKGQGYSSVHLSEVRDYLADPESAGLPARKVILTFDDAQLDFFERVRPLLRRHGFTATVSVPTGYVSPDETCRRLGCWEHGPWAPMMTWKELEQVVTEGFEVLPHSVDHIPFAHPTHFNSEDTQRWEERLKYQIVCSKHTLTARLGLPSMEFFTLPGGDGWGNPDIKRKLEEADYSGALMAWYEPPEKRKFPSFYIPRWEVGQGQSIAEVLDQISSIDE